MEIRQTLRPSRTGGAGSKAAALAVLATAQLVIALDYSIVNVALPDIGRGERSPGRRREPEPDHLQEEPIRQAAA